MKNYEVVALGEALIDFIDNEQLGLKKPILEANPGGAPCNVLAMLAKLGHSVALIGKVGKDKYGSFLADALRNAGIDTGSLFFDVSAPTTLAIVRKLDNGDRAFSFCRNPGADTMLHEDEVDHDMVAHAKIFHFGSFSMTHEISRAATKKALGIAKESGVLISFDPNLRLDIWGSEEEARRQIACGLEYCHILKISDDEIRWLTKKQDFDEGIQWIRDRFNIPLILLTMGEHGSRAYYKNLRVERPAVLQSEDKLAEGDRVGAGDTFCGCILDAILKFGIKDLQESDLQKMLRFANTAAGIIITRKGALTVMPELSEIEALMRRDNQ